LDSRLKSSWKYDVFIISDCPVGGKFGQ